MRSEMISSGGRVNADRFISFSFSDRRNTNQSSAELILPLPLTSLSVLITHGGDQLRCV